MVGKEKYFRILGIDPTEDQNAIKKAYRKMALQYHPDKNDSPNAHVKFIEITEAYEILTGQKQIRSSTGTTYRPKTKEEIIKEKVAAAKARWKHQQAEEERKDREYYAKVAFGWKWRVFQVFAVYTAIWSILMCCDYFLDGESQSYRVDQREVTLDMLNRTMVVEGEMFLVDDHYIWVDKNGRLPLMCTRSYLFGDLKEVNIMITPMPQYDHDSYSQSRMIGYTTFEGKELYTAKSFNSIYGVFPVLQLMLFVPFALVVLKRPNLRFNVWRLVSWWIIFPTTIFFTFNNGRIFHLIELIMES